MKWVCLQGQDIPKFLALDVVNFFYTRGECGSPTIVQALGRKVGIKDNSSGQTATLAPIRAGSAIYRLQFQQWKHLQRDRMVPLQTLRRQLHITCSCQGRGIYMAPTNHCHTSGSSTALDQNAD